MRVDWQPTTYHAARAIEGEEGAKLNDFFKGVLYT